MNTFDGETYDEKRDKTRLSTQLQKVLNLLSDGEKLTLSQIATRIKIPQQSASARLRDLRKTKFGGHNIAKRNLGNGFWQYWLVVPQPSNQTESKS